MQAVSRDISLRQSILQMSEAHTLLIDFWMGHANREMSGHYGKQLLDDVRWRQECAASRFQKWKTGRCWTSPDKFLNVRSKTRSQPKSI